MHLPLFPPRATRSKALVGLMTIIFAFTFAAATCGQASEQSDMQRLLELYELTPQALAAIELDAAPESQSALITALEVIRRVPPHKKIDWAHDVDWSEVANRPEGWCGELALVQGRVRQITPKPLPEAAQQRLGVDEVFQCEIQLAGAEDKRAVLYALSVPTQLITVGELDQRISTTAMMASAAEATGQGTALLLVADRLAWHPDAENIELGVSADHVWLANQGVDVAALDDVRDDAPLAAGDRSSFYQLLAAAGRWDANRLAAAGPQTADITQLLRNPPDHRGHVLTLRGTARRAVPILVDEPDVTSAYGLHRYFEVEVFVDSEMPILVKSGDVERQFNRYPVVYCCRELPDGMPSGETINEPVEITGVYLKTWAYPSAWIAQQTGRNDQMQVSPLLIGRAPKWLATGKPPPSFLERYGGWLFVAAMGVLAAFVWWTARGDRRAKQAFRRRFENQEVDLHALDVEPPVESSE